MEYRMFDIGVNLTSSRFAKGRDDVVTYAFGARVNGLLVIGINLRKNQQAQKLACQYLSCWSVTGAHPHDSSQWQTVTEEVIIELTVQLEVAAIGECGLDFNRNLSASEEQKRAFVAQLRIATELDVPVLMHCRNAHEQFMMLLESWLGKPPGAVPYRSAGTCKEMQACVACGIYIGIIGWVCGERRGLELQELLSLASAKKSLIGIDTLYLFPRDPTSKPSSRRNESTYPPYILQRITYWRGEDTVWLAATTDANVRTLPGIAFWGLQNSVLFALYLTFLLTRLSNSME